MKNLKNLMAAITLLAILVLGTGAVNAGTGLLMSDFTGHQDDPCTESGPTKYDSGVIIGFTGVIIGLRSGIILTDKSSTTPVNCGILMSD